MSWHNLCYAEYSLSPNTTKKIHSKQRFTVSTQPLLLTDLIPNIEFDIKVTSKFSLSTHAAYINIDNWLFDLKITTAGVNINYHNNSVGNNSWVFGVGAELFYGDLNVLGYTSEGLGFFPNLSIAYRWYNSRRLLFEIGTSASISQPIGFFNVGYTLF